ncbi:MAG: dihydrolipoamide acetyltransferase family protein [Gemmataceae bacterium]
MQFKVPELGEGIYEAELVRWIVAPGEAVKHGQSLMEVLTDKATMEVPSPFSGTIDSVKAQSGDTIKVGQHILDYQPAGAATLAAKEKATVASPVAATPGALGPLTQPRSPANGPQGNGTYTVKASPSVRHLARKLNIDLSSVRGSGPGGRVLLEDLEITAATSPREPAKKTSPAEQFDLGKAGSRVKLAGIRKKIAEQMVRAKRTIPHYTYVDECDLTELVRLRASLKESFDAIGVKLTYLPFVVKAAVAALKEVPYVNATLDDEAGEIIVHSEYHIGIATATPSGLMVPVVRDADKKDLTTIAREIDRLSAEARTGRSKRDDLRGGTFTITSIGGIGGLFATPVINHPEVAILGLGKVVKRPVYDSHGKDRSADMAYLSISFDHRVVDGAVGAIFGNALIKQLQNPARLLLP